MKRILLIAAMMCGVAYGQKVIGEAGNRYTRDSFPVFGSYHINMVGNSITGSGRVPLRLMQLENYERYVHNGGIHGQTSTQIKNRFVLDTAKFGWNTIIWAGRNNYSAKSTVLADIAAMVAALGHNRYLIFSVTNSRSEPSGSTAYNQIADLNADLATIYGSHFVDVRAFWVAQYDPGLPQDVTDHGNDVPPNSKMSDPIHPNYTMDTLTARWIYQNNYWGWFDNNSNGVASSGALKNFSMPGNVFQNIVFVKRNGNTNPFLQSWTDGQYNPQGWPAFSDLDWGQDHFLSGYAAGYTPSNGNRSSGSYRYLVGYTTGAQLTTGSNVTGIGGLNFVNATTNSNLTALGRSALELTTGGGNLGIGTYAGRLNITGTNNVWVGYDAGNNASQVNNLTNSTAFGYSSYTTRSNQAVFGNQSTTETLLQGSVGVNMNYVQPKTNVQLQVNSLSKGFMIPRMSAAQRLAMSMSSGDSATTVFDKDSVRKMEYSGSAWRGIRYTNESAISSAGRYTPTITGGTNVASVGTIYSAHYMQVGNEVQISGSFQYTPTAGSLPTYFTISLPNSWTGVNSSYGDAAGTATCSDLNNTTAGFVSYTSTMADLRVTSIGTGTNTVQYTFTFQKN
jgi:hypothetical protein